MGIQTEYNPDLAFRKFRTKDRSEAECSPERLMQGQVYEFLKRSQRNYWLEREIPLLEIKGNQQLSRPLVSIVIIESTHFLDGEVVYTRGSYEIKEVFNANDSKIHFESYRRINRI